MGRKSRHFFEVFSGSWPEGAAPTEAMDPITRSSPPGSAAVGSTPTSRSRCVAFRLTPETLVVLGLLFAGLLFVSHVWGYQRGARSSFEKSPPLARADVSADEDAPVVAGPAKRRAALSVSRDAGSRGADIFYSLCVWTGYSETRARKLQADLKSPAYRTFVVQLKNWRGYTVTVGQFDRTDTPEAKRLKKEFQEKKYGGKKQFTSCHWVPVRK